MTFKDLVEFVECYKHLPNLNSHLVTIEIRHPYSTVEVKSLSFGFKWGNHKLVITPEDALVFSETN